jgi:hypothetical protein
MITLDGFSFHTDKSNYADRPDAPATYGRGLTGLVLAIESGNVYQVETITLNISQFESELLKASFTKCHSTNVNLKYTDERGVTWDTASGNDTAMHKYDCGAWIESLGEPKPATEALFDPFGKILFTPTNRFTTQMVLKMLARDSGYLLTEAGEIINTESSDRLLWQAA